MGDSLHSPKVPHETPPEATQWLYVTASTPEEAERLAKALVGERLAACANILGPMQSFYWWDGAIQSGREVALVLKTRSTLVDAATRRIKALHSYDCPCVVALDIQGGNADYLKWIVSETS
jgi:periplasmic divalent cation tolerance protein